jgi:CO dehydrogenase/acetyl-CoA synthase beta subunit
VIVAFVSGERWRETNSQSGESEVVKAAAQGETGTVRLRVELDGDTTSKGSFDVIVCN